MGLLLLRSAGSMTDAINVSYCVLVKNAPKMRNMNICTAIILQIELTSMSIHIWHAIRRNMNILRNTVVSQMVTVIFVVLHIRSVINGMVLPVQVESATTAHSTPIASMFVYRGMFCSADACTCLSNFVAIQGYCYLSLFSFFRIL
ncbi:unnamed protein product [Gongylonema pulchrum]|uniref:Uncharacterized protein n=1 Tax=Gongylonema pulchrum TaxID=637853 RepID=A0A3P6QJM2_9BILA|nr:unnamed protein product [Gongylonema pulchrum]